jgi:hypothetical protein
VTLPEIAHPRDDNEISTDAENHAVFAGPPQADGKP